MIYAVTAVLLGFPWLYYHRRINLNPVIYLPLLIGASFGYIGFFWAEAGYLRIVALPFACAAMLLVAVFNLWHKVFAAGTLLIGTGGATNLFVIAVNNFHMPVPMSASVISVNSTYVPFSESTNFPWLVDWIELQILYWRIFFSPGDAVAFLGMALLFASASVSFIKERLRRSVSGLD